MLELVAGVGTWQVLASALKSGREDWRYRNILLPNKSTINKKRKKQLIFNDIFDM